MDRSSCAGHGRNKSGLLAQRVHAMVANFSLVQIVANKPKMRPIIEEMDLIDAVRGTVHAMAVNVSKTFSLLRFSTPFPVSTLSRTPATLAVSH